MAAYDSLFNRLLKLADETLVYPGHDYKGDTVSTIGEEKAHNPRLQVASADEYAGIMNNLNLPHPALMDDVVPLNLSIGFSADTPDINEHTITAEKAIERVGQSETTFIDLREDSERARDGVIPGSVHMPYQNLRNNIKPGGCWRRSRPTRIRNCCFIAPSANARRWPITRCRRPGWSTPVIWKAALTAGSRPASPWSNPRKKPLKNPPENPLGADKG